MNNIRKRFIKRFDPIASTVSILLSYDYDRFWVAGSSLLKPIPNDFDIYSCEGFDFDLIKQRAEHMQHVIILHESRNALTLKINDAVVQFCQYKKNSLKDLIGSFDFAHVQIGIEIWIEWAPGDPEDGGGFKNVVYDDVKTTPAWQAAMYEQQSRFTGSEYPLSSLLRVHKYRQRDWLSKVQSKTDILKTLTEVIHRGYENYDDFKDQLQAVDLWLLEPEQCEAAWTLWCVCCDRGLVKHVSHTDQDEFMSDLEDEDGN